MDQEIKFCAIRQKRNLQKSHVRIGDREKSEAKYTMLVPYSPTPPNPTSAFKSYETNKQNMLNTYT
jgi:hypothetical protein